MDYPLPGCMDSRFKQLNQIVRILYNACFSPTSVTSLKILGSQGHDFFEMEIIPRIMDWDGRSDKHIRDYYERYCAIPNLPKIGILSRLRSHMTPSGLAGWYNDVRAVQLLGSNYNDAVLAAAYTNSVDVLVHLKDQRVDFNAEDNFSNFLDRLNRLNPAYLSAYFGNKECIRVLKEGGYNLLKLCSAEVAIQKGHVDYLRELHENGFDLTKHEENDDDESLVHQAAIHGHKECLRLLNEIGCDLRKPNSEGKTAVYYSASYGHVDCLRLLSEFGCDLEPVTNDNGDTPAYIAAWFDHVDCLQFLKDKGCDLRITNFHRQTPYQVASLLKNKKCKVYLEENGFNEL